MGPYCLSQLAMSTIDKMTISKDKLNQFKETLLEEKQRIEKNIKVIGDMDFGDSPGMDNEKADEVEEAANMLPTIETLKGRIDNIDAALEKMESGTYGTCESCEGEIGLELLEANPESATCEECKN